MKLKVRKDLAEQGLAIPCQYQDGAYLLPYQIEGSEHLAELNGGTQHLILLPYENGIRSLAVVDSIDLDYESENA